MDWQRDAIGLVAGLPIAPGTSPAGVSGAVFLLPVLDAPADPDEPALRRGVGAVAPQRLEDLLGVLAISLSVLYAAQAVVAL